MLKRELNSAKFIKKNDKFGDIWCENRKLVFFHEFHWKINSIVISIIPSLEKIRIILKSVNEERLFDVYLKA